MPNMQASPLKRTKPIVIAGITLTWKLIYLAGLKISKFQNIDTLCDGKTLGRKNLTAGFEKEVITGLHWVSAWCHR
jgi:hypothetical protein